MKLYKKQIRPIAQGGAWQGFNPESTPLSDWIDIEDSEEQIEKEIKEAEEELAEVQSNLEDDLDDDELTTEERAEIIESYQSDIDEIKERIADLKEELNEL